MTNSGAKYGNQELLVTSDKGPSDDVAPQKIVLSRALYTQEEYDKAYPAKAKKPFNFADTFRRSCNGSCLIKALLGYLPIIGYIRKYKPKEYVLGDVLSGLTVSFLHLPMAMGFGILAGLRPIHGLYGTFFPVLTYMFFGTSSYISFGSNAVMALLTQTVVEREADIFIADRAAANATIPTEDEIMDVKVGSAMACCFIAGLILMVMGILKMGVITTYLSVSFVGGFTTAAAIHIASSQVPKMFGIKVQSFAGAGKLVRMYIDLLSKLGTTNPAELIICIVCMAVLLLVKLCVNEKYKAKMKMPIPIDLIVVIIGTFISHFAKFNDAFDVKVVGDIPSGFQAPAAPRLQNAGNFASDAFVMAILSLMMSISMAKLCARKHDIPIDDNQELIAYGAANFVSGFFFSFPSATAPPRTMILSTLGAKSTLNAITTSLFMMLVILVIGQLFVSLPMSVLAAMIIISMKDLLLQYRNLPRIWRVNKYDFIIWVVTNSVSVLVDLNYGIIAGIFTSIFLVVLREQCSSGEVVGLADSEDVIVTVQDSVETQALRGIKVFKIPTSFYFATAERIKSQIYKRVLNPKAKSKSNSYDIEAIEPPTVTDEPKKNGHNGVARQDGRLSVLVIDCTSVSYIDMAGLVVLQVIVKEYKSINVDVYLAAVHRDVMKTLTAGDFFDTFDQSHVFLHVFDAISFINKDTSA